MLSLSTMAAEPPSLVSIALTQTIPQVEEDLLGDLAASFDGVPLPVVDPFQMQVMVEVHGTF